MMYRINFALMSATGETWVRNFGGHYNPATSSFICPVDGVYLVSVGFLAEISNMIAGDIMLNNVRLARTYVDAVSNVYNRGSSTIVTECRRSEVLWVRAAKTGILYANSNRHSTFSACLIQRIWRIWRNTHVCPDRMTMFYFKTIFKSLFYCTWPGYNFCWN